MKAPNTVLSSYGTTIFEVMSRLAVEHDAINLGQGFPDDRGPPDVLEAAADAMLNRSNQYPPMLGIPELRQAVADHARRFYELEIDWQTQVVVTSGATQALASCLLGLIEPGDEVVLLEPLYDSYLPIVRRAGGEPRLVRVEPPDWSLPRESLAAAFSDRTKLILFNTPWNPAGRVLTREELEFIASLVERHDALAVCDEVYEHLLFDGRPHVPLMTLPRMADRCVRIGSAGKTFSLTGWKVGYMTGAASLLTPIAKAHQFLVFTTPPNLQYAVAHGLRKDDQYFEALASDLQAKRDRFGSGLTELGFDVLACHGTYFISVDLRSVGFTGDDADFCRTITTEARVAAVPMSAFYEGEPPSHFARFSFCKGDDVLDEALARLRRYFSA